MSSSIDLWELTFTLLIGSLITLLGAVIFQIWSLLKEHKKEHKYDIAKIWENFSSLYNNLRDNFVSKEDLKSSLDGLTKVNTVEFKHINSSLERLNQNVEKLSQKLESKKD